MSHLRYHDSVATNRLRTRIPIGAWDLGKTNSMSQILLITQRVDGIGAGDKPDKGEDGDPCDYQCNRADPSDVKPTQWNPIGKASAVRFPLPVVRRYYDPYRDFPISGTFPWRQEPHSPASVGFIR
jgi:hypothetical protein